MKQSRMTNADVQLFAAPSHVDCGVVCETNYLLAVPGMRESLLEGFAQSPTDLAIALDW